MIGGVNFIVDIIFDQSYDFYSILKGAWSRQNLQDSNALCLEFRRNFFPRFGIKVKLKTKTKVLSLPELLASRTWKWTFFLSTVKNDAHPFFHFSLFSFILSRIPWTQIFFVFLQEATQKSQNKSKKASQAIDARRQPW